MGAIQHFHDEMERAASSASPEDSMEEPNFFKWSPSTLLHVLEEDFGPIPQGCFDRLMAGITIATTDLFWNDLRTFVPLCNVLSGSPITDDFDPATVAEMCWAITEAELLDLDPNNQVVFSEEISAYIYAACQDEGITSPPSMLLPFIGNSIDAPGSDMSFDPAFYADTVYNQKTKTLDIEKAVYISLWKMYSQLETLYENQDIKEKLAELKRAASLNIQKIEEEEASLDA
jgi:hypothetical protein